MRRDIVPVGADSLNYEIREIVGVANELKKMGLNRDRKIAVSGRESRVCFQPRFFCLSSLSSSASPASCLVLLVALVLLVLLVLLVQ